PLLTPRPPGPTLFPYTTLFRSRPHHLDPSALATPSLAISCAAREALHQADVVETMLMGMLTVIKNNDPRLSEDLRKLDDDVDELDRKSTRLNSSHSQISYAVFC